MKNLLKLEEFAQFAFATALFYQLGFAWWVFPLVLLLPDVSMIGYLITPYWGAVSYNFIHHKAFAILIYATGLYFNDNTIVASGLVLFAHSAMDRIFEYGLKYTHSFKHTNLGILK